MSNVQNDILNEIGRGLEDAKQSLNIGEISTPSTPMHSYNWLIWGAPGTGKSSKLKDEAKAFDAQHKDRVTFYPTYTYQQFVGAYKPFMTEKKGADGKVLLDSNGKPEREISYKYVPGPFLRLLTKAILAPTQNFLLIIEELNRANAAAVFGDVFQLLDRKDGKSEYPISISEDMRNYLMEEDKDDIIKNNTSDFTQLSLPKNFYIWATMNSADQGVFPIDTAFKRRWEFEYLGIDEKQGDITIQDIEFEDGIYDWNTIRKTINTALLKNAKVNEDKLLGPFFILCDSVGPDRNEQLKKIFKSKVLMYLFEDAVRHNRISIFKPEKEDIPLSYSNLCERLDKKTGLAGIFSFTIPKKVEKTAEQADNQGNE
jgi:5-methylcytosine-specific restriction endonuclease McrBC GTP-binding regulatory subunit McrB